MPYHVIEFEELPYDNIDKYICVPESWIKWRNKSKGQVIVAYPVEKPSCTQQRVEKDAKYSRKWKCFLAKAEYNTNGYNEAVNFIKYLNNKRNSETEDSNKQEQNKEKTSFSNDNVSDDRQDNETSDDAATYVISELDTDDSETTDGNDNVPDDSKTQDKESSDDNDVSDDSKTHDSDTSDDDDTQIGEQKDRRRKSNVLDDSSSDESEKTEPASNHKSGKPPKRSRENQKIILPPEYDPDFPRWTLKYPETNYRGRMDLIELSPGGSKSGIYVDHRGFKKCLEVSADDNSLARNLLMEIFTQSALRVCTLTGKVPAGFEGDKSEIRPALYVHGVKALVETVLLHGFRDSEESKIRSCLSAKLYHLRSKLIKHYS